MMRRSTWIGLGVADADELPFLQNPEDLDLKGRGGFGDLIEKNRSPVRHLDEPFPCGDGAGKGAFDVPEELAFQDPFRQGPAVDRLKRLFPPPAQIMKGFGGQFLAGSGLAGDENVAVRVGHFVDQVEDPLEGRAVPDDVLKSDLGLEAAAQGVVFRLQPDPSRPPAG